jgi:hypothetical protein
MVDLYWDVMCYPISISNQPNKQPACVDEDGDGYCNWGISATKPSTCPSFCNARRDCDDSNPSLLDFVSDTNFNCRFQNNGCIDSDVGIKEDFVRGTVTLKGVLKGVDSCSGSFAVKEYFCNGLNPEVKIDDCPEMWTCVNGACTAPSCVNSDLGASAGEYFVKGNITWNKIVTGVDSCLSSTYLKEYYCTTGNITTYTYKNCLSFGSNYSCVSGACVAPVICRDSDGGFNTAVKGSASNGNVTKVDVCMTSAVISEAICNGIVPVFSTTGCSAGFICSDGACMQNTTSVKTTRPTGGGTFI